MICMYVLNPSESTNFSHQTKYVNSKRGRDINKIDLILIDFYLISQTCRHFLLSTHNIVFFALLFSSKLVSRKERYMHAESVAKMKIEKWISIVREKNIIHLHTFYGSTWKNCYLPSVE